MMRVAAVALSVAVAPAGHAAPVPALQNCGYGAAQIKPTGLLLYCGDAGAGMENIVWQRWDSRTAVGSGSLWARVCEPNCAAGRDHRTTARIVLGGVKNGRFTTAVIHSADGTLADAGTFSIG
ncbi:hypothetical protein P0W64_11075 [Tsukamurella sp. 8F]|uniref:hypothetical protein n=1 Tax=unclassified Tsukamurella TaxID=2633480 RepID=UPI0023BA2F6A|nr:MULTISPECIES: hypothetical protein [unclassified Tsukamurella]MDF0529917.1 hypothetical protein [Tsukamurella sp. 8J]MDF0587311.1 hypothetical protein [Tsukamurella sp. 8F]